MNLLMSVIKKGHRSAALWSNKIDLKQISLEAAFLELRSGSNNNKDLKCIHGDQNNHTKN